MYKFTVSKILFMFSVVAITMLNDGVGLIFFNLFTELSSSPSNTIERRDEYRIKPYIPSSASRIPKTICILILKIKFILTKKLTQFILKNKSSVIRKFLFDVQSYRLNERMNHRCS